MSSAVSFKNQLAAFAQKAGQRIEVTTRAAVEGIGERLILRTPVDTGFMASNWNFSLKAPDLTVREQTSVRELNGFDATTEALAGRKAYVSNAVHYCLYVEYGTSRMGPQPMVGPTAIEWPSIVAEAVQHAKAARP